MISIFSKQTEQHTFIELFDTSNIIDLPIYNTNTFEKAELVLIKNENRKKEWIISRFLISEVCKKLQIQFLGTQKTNIGQLKLIDNEYYISISHTKGFFAIILSKYQVCGIDIEIANERILKLAPKFLSELELANCQKNLVTTTLFWSAKEVMYKACGEKGIIFAKDFSVVLKEDILEGKINNPKNFPNFNLYYKVFDKLILVWLLENK